MNTNKEETMKSWREGLSEFLKIDPWVNRFLPEHRINIEEPKLNSFKLGHQGLIAIFGRKNYLLDYRFIDLDAVTKDIGKGNTQDIIIHGVGTKDSNIHGVNEMVRLEDIKTYIKEILTFLLIDF